MKNILSENLKLGKGVFVHPTAFIQGVNGQAKNIEIGDHVYIGENVRIFCDEFSIGDYSKIHHDSNIHGYKPCVIGHNAWIGQFTIIDSIGGTTIGNNCGIGASSQLWSHIKYGDTLEGCRFLSESPLTVGDDVWFVGHCIVSPITAENKSMALAGSVITKDMEYNQIYAGSPAVSISDKVGFQFKDVTAEAKILKMEQYLSAFSSSIRDIKIVAKDNDVDYADDNSYFSIESRRYKKMGTEHEVNFMKFLLPDKAKFTPFEK